MYIYLCVIIILLLNIFNLKHRYTKRKLVSQVVTHYTTPLPYASTKCPFFFTNLYFGTLTEHCLRQIHCYSTARPSSHAGAILALLINIHICWGMSAHAQYKIRIPDLLLAGFCEPNALMLPAPRISPYKSLTLNTNPCVTLNTNP